MSNEIIRANLHAIQAGISALQNAGDHSLRQCGLDMQPSYGGLARALDNEDYETARAWLSALYTAWCALHVRTSKWAIDLRDLAKGHCSQLERALYDMEESAA